MIKFSYCSLLTWNLDPFCDIKIISIANKNDIIRKERLFWVTNKAVGAKTHKQRDIIFMQIIQIIKSRKENMQFSEMENFLYLFYPEN